MNSDLDS